jgi:hypothetical protein
MLPVFAIKGGYRVGIPGGNRDAGMPWGHPYRDIIAMILGYQPPAFLAILLLIPPKFISDPNEYMIPLANVTRVEVILVAFLTFQLIGALTASDTLRALVSYAKGGVRPSGGV